MLLTSTEFSSVHLPNHGADIQRLHVRVLKRYESTSVDDYAQKVNVVVLFAQLVTPCTSKNHSKPRSFKILTS